ncbi:MAG: SDR family oxidoreductase [Colwellia sp.]|jgi:NAD(P)-dependent dehydrogenase (short-subunit alcohol dehydrogenase family)|nr:SDR family oxidoreductase [Colwellia sp.]
MKTAIVTGGNSGIGYATAKLLKEKNYDVTITGRSKVRVELAAAELGVKGVVADMLDLQQLKELSTKFEDGLDVLVLNAGIAKFNPLVDSDITKYDEIMDINVKGSYFLTQYLVPNLKMKKGSICFVSSAIVNNGLNNASLYALSKGAIDAVVKSLAVELAPNVRVNAISPGAVRTPILEKYGLPKEELEKRIHNFELTIPLKRYANPIEIAHTIYSQVTASYVTGAIWEVGGGIHSI